MIRVLLLGSGAREHVIAETLKKSRHDVQLFGIGSNLNPGLIALCEEFIVGDYCDTSYVSEYAQKVRPAFAVLGPEAPIAVGMADVLKQLDIQSFAPLQIAGQLESSKAFTRNILTKYEIAGNPNYQEFTTDEGLEDFFLALGEDYVVKADGLKGGKGVKVSGEHLHGVAEGVVYATECLQDAGRVVVEEKLVGQEFSLLSFCDGTTTADMPAAQDHKRVGVGDVGPNTGGMGSYSMATHSLPFLSGEDIRKASEMTKQVANALKEETGVPFVGVMYGGFMATKDGVRLVEYNARFGDPEVMNVLPILETDFVDVCEACMNGWLHELEVKFASKATVCKYVVPQGYPDNSVKDVPIKLGPAKDGLHTYYASVNQHDDGLHLAGSRAVGLVGIGDTVAEAEKIAEDAAKAILGLVIHREDIGTTELIEKRIKMMRELRG